MQRRMLVLCAMLAACGTRRDLIATQPPGTTPFSFPYVDPAIPEAPGQFGGPAGDPMGAPRIAYPLDGAMHPSNLGAITFQWTRGDDASHVFRIRLEDGQGKDRFDFYVPCTLATCLYPMPVRGWLAIAYGHPDATLQPRRSKAPTATGGPVFRVAADLGAVLARAGHRRPLLLDRDQHGRNDLPTAVRRVAGVALHRAVVADQPADLCGGCHSVSRNGTHDLVPSTATMDRRTLSWPPPRPPRRPRPPSCRARRRGPPTGTASRFTALNTDGSRVLVSTFGHIKVFETATGAPVDIGDTDALLPPGHLVTHPEWSPSGRRVVFTLYSMRSPRELTDSRPEGRRDRDAGVRSRDRAGDRLRRIVVTRPGDGLFHFYPSWSPDEHWLVMAAAPGGTSAYTATAARLRLASADMDNQTARAPPATSSRAPRKAPPCRRPGRS